MIELKAQWFTHAPIKLGHSPERRRPEDPPEVHDAPENVPVCLDCPFPDECHMGSSSCPVSKKRRKSKIDPQVRALDEKVVEMISSGWQEETVCVELDISKEALKRSLNRTRARERYRESKGCDV